MMIAEAMRMSASAARERQRSAKSDGDFDAGSAKDAAALWDRVRRRLQAELGEDVFSSWFARVDLEEQIVLANDDALDVVRVDQDLLGGLEVFEDGR